VGPVALAYILGGGLNDQPGAGRELYERYGRVRDTFRDVAEWTGLSVARVLDDDTDDDEFRAGVGAIRQAAVVIATHDLLADHGIHPAVVAGLSLGGLIGATLAGALDRADLFALLMRAREAPTLPEGAPEQGVALLSVPIEEDVSRFWQLADRHVYPAADLGPVSAGRERVLILAGLRDALAELTATLPPEWVQRSPQHAVAFHTPLQQHVHDHLAPLVDAIAFRAPAVPVCSCFEPAVLTDAESIRAMFHRNSVDPVSVVHMRHGLEELDTELGIVLGPSQFDRYLTSPFPVVHVETPEHLAEAIETIHDLGVELPDAPAEVVR
jgi:[acyl-carrier-protein] S-malonyltransferase